jgi:hypothetical protein
MCHFGPQIVPHSPLFAAEMALAEYGFLEDIIRGHKGYIEPPSKCSKYSPTL